MKVPTIVLALAALLFIAAAATAQIGNDRVRTWLEVEEPEGVEDWDGSPITRTLNVRLCYEEGVANPTGQMLTINVTVENIPDWVHVEHPETVSLMPPMGPTSEEGCTEPQTVDIQLRAMDQTGNGTQEADGSGDPMDPDVSAQQGMPDNGTTNPGNTSERRSFTVDVRFTPSEENGGASDPSLGNYEPPEEETVTFQVRTTDDPERVPGPELLAALTAIALLALVAARRRH